jgi:hypothetical protein
VAYEEVVVKSTKSRSNVFHVPLRKWRTWDPRARQVFNEVYSAMAGNQTLFLHPHQDKISRRMWKTYMKAYMTKWRAARRVSP